MTRKIIYLFLNLLILSSCSRNPFLKKHDKNEQNIKIGLNLELSGSVAGYGSQERDGVVLAVEEINKSGGILEKKVDLVEKDNRSNNNDAASIIASLSTIDKVSAIIGPATSSATKSAIPNINKAKIPLMTPSSTDDKVTIDKKNVHKFIFRSCFQDSFQGKILGKYTMDILKAHKVAILGDNSNDYATGLKKAFKEEYKGDIVVEENFSKGDKDFQAILTKIKKYNFDVLYVPSYYEEAGLIIKQAREMGINNPIIGADGFGDKKMIELAGSKNVSNVYYTGHFSFLSPSNDKVMPFINSFKEKYGKTPSTFSALAYDAMFMIKKAIESTGSSNPEAIQKGLSELKNFVGITGNITINKKHNTEKSLVVIGLTDGKETSANYVNL